MAQYVDKYTGAQEYLNLHLLDWHNMEQFPYKRYFYDVSQFIATDEFMKIMKDITDDIYHQNYN